MNRFSVNYYLHRESYLSLVLESEETLFVLRADKKAGACQGALA